MLEYNTVVLLYLKIILYFLVSQNKTQSCTETICPPNSRLIKTMWCVLVTKKKKTKNVLYRSVNVFRKNRIMRTHKRPSIVSHVMSLSHIQTYNMANLSWAENLFSIVSFNIWVNIVQLKCKYIHGPCNVVGFFTIL